MLSEGERKRGGREEGWESSRGRRQGKREVREREGGGGGGGGREKKGQQEGSEGEGEGVEQQG